MQILSGTDVPNFKLVPGKSLHHELELLAEAGIKPMDIIERSLLEMVLRHSV